MVTKNPNEWEIGRQEVPLLRNQFSSFPRRIFSKKTKNKKTIFFKLRINITPEWFLRRIQLQRTNENSVNRR